MYDIPTAQKPVEEENKLPEVAVEHFNILFYFNVMYCQICRLHGLFESLEHELDSIQVLS